MTPRQLQQFIAVAEELHFGRAASRLNMAQPPLTMAIRRLEEQIGVTLLERSSRQVAMTAGGTVFLREARDILKGLDAAIERTRRAARREIGSLDLGFLSTSSVLPPLIRAARDWRPDLELRLTEATTAEQLDLLGRGRLDIGILRPPKRPPPGIAFKTIARQPLMAAVATDHRFAGHAAVDVADLADEPFVSTPPDDTNGLDHAVTALCRQAGFEPHTVQIAREMPSLMALVAAGIGVAVVPRSSFVTRYDGVAILPLAQLSGHPTPTIDLQFAWLSTNGSGVLKEFMEAVEPALSRNR